MKTIVLYKSKYGSSEQYASWIADSLSCLAKRVKDINKDELKAYDVIIYAGGLYAGAVNGFGAIKKQLHNLQDKKIILCMVGATPPEATEKYLEVFNRNVPEEYRNTIKWFALRGNQLFSKMSFMHRIMMKVPKKMAERIPEGERTEEDIHFIERFGKDSVFVDMKYGKTVTDYVKAL